MDDYYSKYAKPINPFCYDNAIAKMKEWHSGMKEELEMFIFIEQSIKNDSLNKIAQSKVKAKNAISKLKENCIELMQETSEYIIRVDKMRNKINEEKMFSSVEGIRDRYNKMLLANNKYITSTTFLNDLKGIWKSNHRKNTKNSHSMSNILTTNSTSNSNNNIKPYKSLLNSNSVNAYLPNNTVNFDFSKENSVHFNKVNATLNKSKRSHSYIPKATDSLYTNKSKSTFKQTMNDSIKLEQLSTENYNLKNDITNIKSQLNMMAETIRLLSEKIDKVQNENNALRAYNQNLVSFIQQKLNK